MFGKSYRVNKDGNVDLIMFLLIKSVTIMLV